MAFYSKNNTPRETKAVSGKRAPLTQYYRSKNEKGTSPFRRNEPKKAYRRVVFSVLDILLLALLLLGLVYSLMLSGKPKIVASNTVFHSQAEYTAAASSGFKGFRNTNKITVDEGDIARKLKTQFPEISKVQIELPFFSQRPTLRLSIARSTIELVSNDVAYIIDSDGVAAAKVSDLPSVKNIAQVVDQSGFDINVGKQALGSSQSDFIKTLFVQLRNSHVPIESATLPKIPQELDIRTKDQKYYVKFTTSGDALTQVGQYLAARHEFALQKSQPSQYLDVRVSGKIFYR